MKCPECQKLGLKSIVTPGVGISTAVYCVPFYDEDGNYHHHDGNVTIAGHSCSNGHKWTERKKEPCPHEGCDWNLVAGESDGK